VPDLPGVRYDEDFPPTPLPGRVPRAQAESVFDAAPYELTLEPEASTYIVRAAVEEENVDALLAHENVIGVFADPVIETQIVCPGSPPLGSDADVERLLCTASMRAIGMDGQGVLVAIVDTGINIAYLNSHGKHPSFDAARSWVPSAGLIPGSLPVDHGTMCAYDVCIAAPKCTLLDIAVLKSTAPGPTVMAGLLSDAVRAYRYLCDVMLAPRRPGEARSLVVSNSWGMFQPSWDFPPGHPGNYSDNPNHPFNRIVGDLERVGADILFAAGNCGTDCPDGRCAGLTANVIYGANGHPAVLSVAGVDTTKARVGYSSMGPGRLTRNKPDISGYTHFRGSGVYPADGGTSAATPVVAGVVAAVRSKRPYEAANPSTHPAAVRSLMTATAADRGAAGYDFLYGYGIVNGCELYRRFGPSIPIIDLCRRYPWICRGFPRLPFLQPEPSVSSQATATEGLAGQPGFAAGPEAPQIGEEAHDPVELAYLVGYLDGQKGGGPKPPQASGSSGGCGCGGKQQVRSA
jgi:hypothetical protein